MLYIILIVIAVFVYLIYKGQKPKIISKEEAVENIKLEISCKEEYLLNKIKTSHLKDYMQTETALFECGRKNFLRLSERFKHDDIKFAQTVKDWIDYIDTISEVIFVSEMLDVANSNEEVNEYRNNQQELFIKIQETEKRFKDLLGNEYIDPNDILNPQSKL